MDDYVHIDKQGNRVVRVIDYLYSPDGKETMLWFERLSKIMDEHNERLENEDRPTV
jgi:hypothetical protein